MQWQSSWIWLEGEPSPRNAWVCFRKSFELDRHASRVEEARLSITADSRYVLYVNGQLVGRGPVRSWPFEQAYDTYDLRHLLRPGRNCLAVLVTHFGASTFSYVRGRGGLLAQLELSTDDGRTTLGTDGSWKAHRHLGYSRRTTRISPQQGFVEQLDARAWPGEWTDPAYDDSGWEDAKIVGPVGTPPWERLVPRDIPCLTEEVLHPTRVVSLHSVVPPQIAVAVDMRAIMMPDSADHAEQVQYAGFLATILRADGEGTARLLLSKPWVGDGIAASINGQVYGADRMTRTPTGRELEVELSAGDNLLLVYVCGSDHADPLRLALDSDLGLELVPPLGGESPFVAIGPLGSRVVRNFDFSRPLEYDEAAVQRISSCASAADLHAWAHLLRPVPPELVSPADVFTLCTWPRRRERLSTGKDVEAMVVPSQDPGVAPILRAGDTELVLDFGQEVSGYLFLDVEASEGTVIDFYGFEFMEDDYRQDTVGLDNTLRYTCREGRQRYVSPQRRGLRYLMLTVRHARAPLRVHGVGVVQSTYPVSQAGTFRCSDPLLNDIWEISRLTTKLCMEDTFVDCPAYEQTFWVGDSRNEALIAYYLFGAEELVRRCLRLVPGSRRYTPLYMDQVPSGWVSVIPNWTFLWVMACREYYERTGDLAFVQGIWPDIQYTLDHYLQHLNGDGLLEISAWNLLDWAPIDQPNSGVVTHQNCFLVRALMDADELGRSAGDETARRYAERARELAAAINAHLWSPQHRAYIDSIHADGRRSDTLSMQTQVVALLTGVAEGDRAEVVRSYITSPPAGWVQIGSPFMSFFLYEAMVRQGMYAQMLEDIRHKYGMMLEHGATTCWETFPGALGARYTRSHCHAWSAAPGYFLGAYVLGVRPGGPGWRRVIVAPQPCDLAWALGSVPLPRGDRVDVSWRRDGQKLLLRVERPREVELEVVPPEGYELEVEERVRDIAPSS